MRRLGIAERRFEAGAEFGLAPGQCRGAALAFRPIARRHVEQRLREPVSGEQSAGGLRWMVVGPEIFDRLEAALRCGGKAIEKPDLLKDKAQIGCEFRHGTLLLDAAS